MLSILQQLEDVDTPSPPSNSYSIILRIHICLKWPQRRSVMYKYETFILREPSRPQETFTQQPPLSDRFLFTVLKANAPLFCTINVHQVTKPNMAPVFRDESLEPCLMLNCSLGKKKGPTSLTHLLLLLFFFGDNL